MQSPQELVLRAAQPFNFCVIDEVDSILIDEARTPLIISGTSDKPSDKYFKAAKIAAALTKDLHYTVDEKQRNVLLTEDGYEAVEDVLQVSPGTCKTMPGLCSFDAVNIYQPCKHPQMTVPALSH